MKNSLLFSRVGRNAYKNTPVWNLGFHKFDLEDGAITVYRLVYLRCKKGTYYVQYSRENFKRWESCD